MPGQMPPQGTPDHSGQGPAEKAITMIQQGYQQLAQLVQSAQGLPPEDVKLFQQAAKATEAMIDSLTGGEEGEMADDNEKVPTPKGPMSENESPKGSKPASY